MFERLRLDSRNDIKATENGDVVVAANTNGDGLFVGQKCPLSTHDV